MKRILLLTLCLALCASIAHAENAREDSSLSGQSAVSTPAETESSSPAAIGWADFLPPEAAEAIEPSIVIPLMPPFDLYYAADLTDFTETGDEIAFCPVDPVPDENGQYGRFRILLDLTLCLQPDADSALTFRVPAGTELGLAQVSPSGWMRLRMEDASEGYLFWPGALNAEEGTAYSSIIEVFLADEPLFTREDISLAEGGALMMLTDGNLFSGPGMNYPVMTFLPQGSQLEWLGKSATDNQGLTWLHAAVGETEGWVFASACQLPAAASSAATPAPVQDGVPVIQGPASGEPQYTGQMVVGKTGNSYLREGPTLRDKEAGSLRKGSSLPFLGQTSVDERGVVWYMVEYKGEAVWVSSRYTVLE